MTSISFQNLPEKYETLKNEIKDKMIQKIYSQITFKYISISEINENKKTDDENPDTDNSDQIESFLIDYLKKYNIIIYHYSYIFKIAQNRQNSNANNSNGNSIQNVDVIICVEKECIIIQQISITIFESVIKYLKDQRYSILNVTPDSKNGEEVFEEKQAKEEIKNFCSNFVINQNKFLELTIYSIAGYFIRRYYYPSEYFKDPSFFSNGGLNKTQEQKIKKKIDSLIFPFEFSEFIEKKMSMINEEIEEFKNNNNESQQKEFNETEFIVLRELFAGTDSIFYLVFHRENLYIYTMKKIFSLDKKFENEFEFCRNYSHRCMTHFYGFLIKKDRTIGFIYEFMCNGSLSDFISSQEKDINDELFSIITIIRLSQGINYLHSNFLIHRDIKPSNILLDHDLIPYISDFDRVLNLKAKQDNEFTSDIGSSLYASPEQYNSNNYSYPTDIYSFGKIIYFLFEKKHMIDETSFQMENSSQIIQELYNHCIQTDPINRPTNEEIKNMINEEINSFHYYENFFMTDNNQIFSKFVQFIFENLLIQSENNEELNDNLSYFQLLFLVKINEGISSLYLNIGNLYFYGCNVEKDISKAIKYYQMSADENNNPIALINLGNIYANGVSVEQDYSIAKSYYEKAEEHSAALFNLGYLYFFGLGVNIDLFKAKDYFNSSLEKKESELIYTMGRKYNYDYKFNKKNPFRIHNDYFNFGNPFTSNIDNPFSISSDYSNPFSVSNNIYNPFSISNNIYNPFSISSNIDNPFSISSNFDNQYMNPNNFRLHEYLFDDPYEDSNRFDQNHLKVDGHYVLPSIINDFGCLDYLRNLDRYDFIFNSRLNIDVIHQFYFLPHNFSLSNVSGYGYFYIYSQGLLENYLDIRKYIEFSVYPIDFILFLGHAYENGNGTKEEYSKAKIFYEIAEKKSNSTALLCLGNLYFNGRGVDKNYKKAKEYYEKSAEQQNPLAIFNIGNLYFNGFGVNQDYKKAKEYFEISANENDPLAQLHLGNIYMNGLGVDRDYYKALFYYELSANQDNPIALLNLGYIYFKGKGVNQDYLKAKEYYELSAEQNNYDALNNLGFLYNYDLGVKMDHLKAKEYYEKSAEKENSSALLNLGFIYENGYGVTRDYLKAKYYYELSINKENSTALFNLACLYFKGKGIQKDHIKAFELLEQSAKQNNSFALLKLGKLYLKGEIVEKNYLKAKKCFEVSAAKGNSISMKKLGDIYINGYGVTQHFWNALECYKISANLNNCEALFILGEIYSTGIFIDKDISKSLEFYSKCIEIYNQINTKNDSVRESTSYTIKYNKFRYISYNNAGLIYLFVNNDSEKAFEYIKQSSFGEFSFGQNNYGLINQFYLDNIENAKYFYKKAAKKNFALAEYNLGYIEEANENIEEAVKYYINASEHEDYPLDFLNKHFTDDKFEVSKIFILCFVNLKLTEYFLSKSNIEESKKYFIRSFAKLTKNKSYSFKFILHERITDDIFVYLKAFIINFPSFNFTNQPDLLLNLKDLMDLMIKFEKYFKIENDKENNELFELEYKENSLKINDVKSIKNNYHMKIDSYTLKPIKNKHMFDDPGELFDFIIENNEFKDIFISEIKKIINVMNEILYKKPYSILFGRIRNDKIISKENKNSLAKNINKLFYDGLYLQLI